MKAAIPIFLRIGLGAMLFGAVLGRAALGGEGAKNGRRMPPESDLFLPPAGLTVGAQWREEETEGLGDLVLPAWRFPAGLLFVNPRASRTDRSAEEYNLGLGYRHLFTERKWIIGANLFYDYRDTGRHTYDQWGLGVEFLGEWLDARANFYKPDDSPNVVAAATQTTVDRRVATYSEWSDPYATGHLILQDFRAEKIMRTTTTTFYFEQYERAMEGFDVEGGIRLPLPLAREIFEARMFGGHYHFDSNYRNDIEGFKARVELRLLSSVFLDAAWFEDDRLGSDYAIGARVSVPFDLARLARGRNPFAEAGNRFRGEPVPFEVRLTEMVMRDPHVRTEISDFIEDPDRRQTHSSTRREAYRETHTLMGDVNFVHGDRGSGTGDGSAERPYDTIQQGVDSSFGEQNVYVYNASGPYNENVELSPGVKLWGSGCLIPGDGGKSFGSGIHPVVDGRSLGPSISLANQTTVRGFRIVNTEQGGPADLRSLPVFGIRDVRRAGILGHDVTDILIACNRIEGNEQGVLIGRAGPFDLSFINNEVSLNSSGVGVGAEGGGPEDLFGVVVENCRFYHHDSQGLELNASDYTAAGALIRGCAFAENGGTGAGILLKNSRAAYVLVADSEAAGNGGNGWDVRIRGGDVAIAHLCGLSADRNGLSGIRLDLQADKAALGLIGLPNVLAEALARADKIFEVPSEFRFLLGPTDPVEAGGNTLHGVEVTIAARDLAAWGCFDITAHQNHGNGIRADVISTDEEAYAIYGGVRATGNHGDGLYTRLEAAADGQIALVDMQANSNVGRGVSLVVTSLNESAYAILGGVTTIGNQHDGIATDLAGGADSAVVLSDVVSLRNNGRGVNAFLMAGDDARLWTGPGAWDSFRNVYSLQIDEPGWLSDLVPQGAVVTSGNTNVGLRAELVYAGDDVGISLAEVTANGNRGAAGMQVYIGTAGGRINGCFSNVVADGNTGAGLDITAGGAGIGADLDLVRVAARENQADGIAIIVDHTGDVRVFGRNLVCADNGQVGVSIDTLVGGILNMDFGGGTLGSPGLSSFYGNTLRDFWNYGPGTVRAENNWWGTASPASGQFGGSVDYTPWLLAPPAP